MSYGDVFDECQQSLITFMINKQYVILDKITDEFLVTFSENYWGWCDSNSASVSSIEYFNDNAMFEDIDSAEVAANILRAKFGETSQLNQIDFPIMEVVEVVKNNFRIHRSNQNLTHFPTRVTQLNHP